MAQFHKVVAHPLKRIITLMISSQDNTVSDYWVFFFFNYIRQVNSFVTLPQNKQTFRKVFSIYLDWTGQSWHSETIHTIKNKYYSTTVRGRDSPPLPSIPSSTHTEQSVFRREIFATTARPVEDARRCTRSHEHGVTIPPNVTNNPGRTNKPSFTGNSIPRRRPARVA